MDTTAVRRREPDESTLPAGALTLDRKSTRLNSSHSQISYAVFCLKKNKLKPLPKFYRLLSQVLLVVINVIHVGLYPARHHDLRHGPGAPELDNRCLKPVNHIVVLL